jgi:hypothetical protein
MTEQEIRVRLVAGALAGLSGLNFGALGELCGKDAEAVRLHKAADREGLVAHLATQIAMRARAGVGA